MRVIYSIGGCTFNGGGIGKTSYHAVSGIHRHGLLAQLIVPAYRPSKIPEQFITKVPSRIRGLRRLVGDSWASVIQDLLHAKLSARVMQEEADIFHGWAGMSLAAMQKIKDKKWGTKIVLDRASSHILAAKEIITEEYQSWGLDAPGYIDWAIRRELQEYELADFIFTPSEFARESFLKRGFPKEKVRLIRFGTEPIPPAAQRAAQTPVGCRNALFVGEVGFRKGILYALQAWQKADINKGTFYVVGPITKEIRPFLARFKSDPTIKFTGFADSSRYYPRADVLIFPSLEEGSALVTYEAMAYGLPLITTFNSGSVITHGREGFIVAERHPTGVCEALERLAAEPELWQRMSQQARATIQQYTWYQYGEAIVNSYQPLLS